MSIKHAILGVLSWKPTTGYDLKKFFEDSSAMYWSGNNNQIYKALVQLLDEGLVTNEIQHQDNAPTKKIYTITGKGLNELKQWVISTPEAPEFRKTFLVQLSWADLLTEEELSEALANYENEVKMQLLIHEEKKRRSKEAPSRSSREVLLWDMISENVISSYRNELNWIENLRQQLYKKGLFEE